MRDTDGCHGRLLQVPGIQYLQRGGVPPGVGHEPDEPAIILASVRRARHEHEFARDTAWPEFVEPSRGTFQVVLDERRLANQRFSHLFGQAERVDMAVGAASATLIYRRQFLRRGSIAPWFTDPVEGAIVYCSSPRGCSSGA